MLFILYAAVLTTVGLPMVLVKYLSLYCMPTTVCFTEIGLTMYIRGLGMQVHVHVCVLLHTVRVVGGWSNVGYVLGKCNFAHWSNL